MALAPPTWMVDEGVTSLGGALYTFGGRNQQGNTAAAYKFDGTAWTTIAPLPNGIPSASAVNDGTRIYVLGRSDSLQSENVLFRYNPETNAYSRLASFDAPTSAHSVVYLNGKIYKFCGKFSNSYFDTTDELEIYDIATSSWTIGTSYPLSASYVGAFVQGGLSTPPADSKTITLKRPRPVGMIQSRIIGMIQRSRIYLRLGGEQPWRLMTAAESWLAGMCEVTSLKT